VGLSLRTLGCLDTEGARATPQIISATESDVCQRRCQRNSTEPNDLNPTRPHEGLVATSLHMPRHACSQLGPTNGASLAVKRFVGSSPIASTLSPQVIGFLLSRPALQKNAVSRRCHSKPRSASPNRACRLFLVKPRRRAVPSTRGPFEFNFARSANSIPDPTTRSLTVPETRTSAGFATFGGNAVLGKRDCNLVRMRLDLKPRAR
jgi:hypothetical protein